MITKRLFLKKIYQKNENAQHRISGKISKYIKDFFFFFFFFFWNAFDYYNFMKPLKWIPEN